MKIIDVPQTGKCGLAVSFRGRNGLIRRQFVVPRNPQTLPQQEVRGTLANIAARFDSLTTAQQDAWSTAGAAYQTRATLGQSGPMTGLQLFVKINATLTLLGQAAVDSPPAVPQFPALAPQNLVITNTGGVVALKLTTPSDPGENTIVRGSKPVSAGIRAVPGVVMLGICPAPVLGSCDITALYTAEYGVPPVGKQVFVQCNQHVDGYQSLPMTFSAVVPATT